MESVSLVMKSNPFWRAASDPLANSIFQVNGEEGIETQVMKYALKSEGTIPPLTSSASLGTYHASVSLPVKTGIMTMSDPQRSFKGKMKAYLVRSKSSICSGHSNHRLAIFFLCSGILIAIYSCYLMYLPWNCSPGSP